MRKIIVQEFITIDGFAADQDGTTSFFNFLAGEGGKEIDQDLLKFMDTIDTILLGANTYKMFVDYWPEATTKTEIVAKKLNTLPKIVFSKTLESAPWGKWDAARIIKTDIIKEIAKLKKQPGKDMVVWGSISLAQSLMKEGLIDEFQLRICPIVLGKGKPLFSDRANTINMKLMGVKAYDNGLVFLRYGIKN